MFTIRNTFVCVTFLLLVCTLAYENLSFSAAVESITSSDENADAGDTVTNFPIRSNLVAEKTVTFYTSYGYEIGQHWHIPFKLQIFEPSEPTDTTRTLLRKNIRNAIRDEAGIKKLTDVQKERYEIRIADFIATGEITDKVVIMFDGDATNTKYALTDEHGNAKTDRNGNLQGTIIVSEERSKVLLQVQSSQNGWLKFSAVSEGHRGTGLVRLIPPTGTSIISDIDDTIKITGVAGGLNVILKNTFFETLEQVPCMADLYSSFDDDVAFHYMSGAPWQIYDSLVRFMFEQSDGYPQGSLHMNNAQAKLSENHSYKDIWKLLKPSSGQVTYEQNVEKISELVERFPKRQFVLIGDSGEQDPEVFKQIREKYPANVERIIIRDIDNNSKQSKKRFDNMNIIAGNASVAAGCPKRDSLMQ